MSIEDLRKILKDSENIVFFGGAGGFHSQWESLISEVRTVYIVRRVKQGMLQKKYCLILFL